MLSGQNIIYFAPGKWDDLWRSRQQLMSVFARQNKVLYVEGRLTLGITLDLLVHGDVRSSELRYSSLRQISENLFVFRYPFWAPVSEHFHLNKLTRKVRRHSLQEALRTLHVTQPIVFLSQPEMWDLVNEIPPGRLLIYHLFDEYSGYSGHTSASIRRTQELEKKMMGLADMVIVVSTKLYEVKRPFNPNTYLVPHGVDYQAYSAALADPHLPDDLRHIRSPRLGYSGLISSKLNFDMLRELAEQNPEWSLVFLGKVSSGIKQAECWRALRALPNVYYLGLRDVSHVPHYVKGFQVGLMPYVSNRQIENSNPLKLHDYLAAGLPVASVDVPTAREFSQYIHIADNPRKFSDTVRAALADTAPERCQARRTIAAQNTWEARVELLSDLIKANLAEKLKKMGVG